MYISFIIRRPTYMNNHVQQCRYASNHVDKTRGAHAYKWNSDMIKNITVIKMTKKVLFTLVMINNSDNSASQMHKRIQVVQNEFTSFFFFLVWCSSKCKKYHEENVLDNKKKYQHEVKSETYKKIIPGEKRKEALLKYV